MKLLSFRVQNFRSIVDSREIELSKDNVNVLIGQNESGKSSLLEALYVVQTGEITIDDLRFDNENPIITCKFQFDDIEELKNYAEGEGFIVYSKIEKELIKNDLKISVDFLYKGQEFFAQNFADEEFSIFLEELKPELQELEESSRVEEEYIKQDGTTGKRVEKDKYLIEQADFIKILYDLSPDILLFEDDNLLPSRIDLNDIKDKKSKVKGKKGVSSFLRLIDVTVKDLEEYNGERQRLISSKIGDACDKFSQEFSKFWSQKLGKKDQIAISMEVNTYGNQDERPGELYLSFWIKDKNGDSKPEQRSKGVRWYISFFLQMKYYSENFGGFPRVILIDEPGANLHAKAQRDILKMFEHTSKSFQVIYATHSPFLIDIDKIYRVLAVERVEEKNGKSNTQVFDFHKLGSASEDTLTPLYTHMGVSLGHQGLIKAKNNIILEEISAYFYIKGILKIWGYTGDVSFLPATGVSKIPKLCNLLLGWGIDFGILVDDDSAGRKVYNEVVKKSLILEDSKAVKIKGCDGIEDLFDKRDFAKHILKEKVSIGKVKNSEFLKINKSYSKVVLAKNFHIKVEKGHIKKEDFSVASIKKIEGLIDSITGILK